MSVIITPSENGDDFPTRSVLSSDERKALRRWLDEEEGSGSGK
jgi:hypothetical protein